MVSPTLISNRSRMPSLDRHLGLRRRAVPERAVDDPLVRLEVVAIGDRVLARERSARAHVLEALELRLAPADAGHPGAQHRHQLDRPAPCAGSARNARTPSAWSRWMSIRNMSGASADTWIENSLEQARLQRPDADDEERAEADGQQDDARLVAGPRQVQHRVAQRERSRVRERRDRPRPAARPASAARTPAPAKPAQTTRPTRSDAACQAVSATSAARHQRRSRRMPTQSRGCAIDSSRSSSDGLTNRTCSSGTIENSSDTSTPIADALQRRAPRHAVLALRQQRRRRRAERERNGADGERAPAATPSRLPARPSVSTCRM